MPTQRQNALDILVLAILLGLLADLLVRDASWGINIVVWTWTFLCVIFVLHRRMGMLMRKGDWFVLWLIIACSALLPWRDSHVLCALTFLAMVTLTGSLGVSVRKPGITNASMLDYMNSLLASALHSIAGSIFLFFNDLRPEARSSDRPGKVAPVLRGFALSIPLLFFFGSLFMAADAVFEQTVRTIVDVDLTSALEHCLTIGFVTWIVAGFFRGRYIAKEVRLPENARPQSLALGKLETCIVLGAVDTLFLLFVLVQVRYLFGGADLVGITPGLTYAEYARRGFFELVTVAGLSLPLLLTIDWLHRREEAAASPVIRLLMALQVVLLLTIMASATMRMAVYQSEYGLTELRLYVTAFMAWLTLVFFWFALTVLRGKRSRFAFGSFMAAVGTLFALYIVNPEDVIARTNISRALEGKRFDARYIALLRDDATPAVIAALPSLSPEDRSIIATALLRSNASQESPDWRSWNWSREKARRLLNAEERALKSMDGEKLHKEE